MFGFKGFGGISWQSFLMGAAAAIIGPRVARPALVELVKGGLLVTQEAGGILAEAKLGLAHAQASGSAATQQALLDELRSLRAEVNELRARVGGAKS